MFLAGFIDNDLYHHPLYLHICEHAPSNFCILIVFCKM